MRNELLGYLLDALESDERAQVESELATDPELRGQMELLRGSLAPLESTRDDIAPPQGLTGRAVNFVFMQAALHSAAPAPDGPAVELPPPKWSDRPAPSRRWRMADVSVAAGIVVAAMSVVVPAIIQSRANAERRACQNRLLQTHAGIAQYAGLHKDMLPVPIPKVGFEGKAGYYAPLLRDAGYLDSDELVVCPGSELAAEDYEMPTLAQLRAAQGRELERLMRRMGGTFAFAIGYRENGQYRPLILHIGADFPLMADLPGEDGKPIGHHGACGRNVLTADGRVQYIVTCCWQGTRDNNIFANNAGEIDAGKDRHDSVLLPSDKGPSLPAGALPFRNVDRSSVDD